MADKNLSQNPDSTYNSQNLEPQYHYACGWDGCIIAGVAFIVGRPVWFYGETGILMHGVVVARSSVGRLTVLVYGSIDGLALAYIEPEQTVYFSEESAVAHPPIHAYEQPPLDFE